MQANRLHNHALPKTLSFARRELVP